MSKIAIDDKMFNTEMATHDYDLHGFDGNSNQIRGHLYRSSRGTWYVYTPSQWSNRRRWEITTGKQALLDYSHYLGQEQMAEIAKLCELDWE